MQASAVAAAVKEAKWLSRCLLFDGLGLAGCEQRDRLARVIEDEVLEVLVVRHAPGPSVLGGIEMVATWGSPCQLQVRKVGVLE